MDRCPPQSPYRHEAPATHQYRAGRSTGTSRHPPEGDALFHRRPEAGGPAGTRIRDLDSPHAEAVRLHAREW